MKENNARYKQYILFAEEDLKSARVLLEEELYNQSCFHSQQVVEKCLKSFVKLEQKIVPKTHNLLELLQICIKFNKNFKSLSEGCKFLGKFYLPTRYPDAMVGFPPEGLPTKQDAGKSLEFAEEMFSFLP